MKQLLPVVFTYAPAAQSASSTPTSTPHNPITPNSVSSSSTPPPVCPSCSKEISNATKSVLLVSKVPAGGERKKDSPSICGHVVCHTCAETIVKPSKACVVCEAQVRPDKDIVDLGKEGAYSSLESADIRYRLCCCWWSGSEEGAGRIPRVMHLHYISASAASDILR